MVRFRASSYSKYNTNYRLFLELQCMFLFGPRDLVPCVRRGGLLTSWLSRFKLSPTTQFPRFFERFRQLRLLNRAIFSSTTVKQIPLCATLWSILSSVVIDESTVCEHCLCRFDFLDGSKGFYDSCKHFLFYFTKFALQN
jgi:hypothetical protein